MISTSRQQWTPGQQVRIGFLTLTVRAAVATPGDFAPDAYILTNGAGTQSALAGMDHSDLKSE